MNEYTPTIFREDLDIIDGTNSLELLDYDHLRGICVDCCYSYHANYAYTDVIAALGASLCQECGRNRMKQYANPEPKTLLWRIYDSLFYVFFRIYPEPLLKKKKIATLIYKLRTSN